MTTYSLQQGVNTVVKVGGQPVLVIPANTYDGGVITNPGTYYAPATDSFDDSLSSDFGGSSDVGFSDQGIPYLENLYLSLVSSNPGLSASNTTVALAPGQSFTVRPGLTYGVYVTAATSGHRFIAYYSTIGSNYPPTPVPGKFPPKSYTTMTSVIPSFLYKEYEEDDDLQAFVATQNALAQRFLDTVNGLNLPIYTGDVISGLLLDWVGQGVYGIVRPPLSSNMNRLFGPFNTYQFDALTFNGSFVQGPANIVATPDDTYKRIMTWALLKGDGKVINIRWLKRRIMRFLYGVNGTNPNIDQTYRVSITFGPNNEIAIKFIDQLTTPGFGAIFNGFGFNTAQFNEQTVTIVPLPPLPYRLIFQEAAQTGAIELPFQFLWNVYI
jgi:hypothetical protein